MHPWLGWHARCRTNEALLSQYLEMDWTWGWGENPLLAAMRDAVERGVRLRVTLNGAYLDDDMQTSLTCSTRIGTRPKATTSPQ